MVNTYVSNVEREMVMNTKLIFLGGEDASARIEISKKFIALGYEIEIVGTQDKTIFAKNNIAYKNYSLNRELNLFEDIKTIFELRKILKKQRKNTIIHAFDTKPTIFLPLSAFGLKNIKIVRTITGMGRIFTDNSLRNNILKIVYNIIQKFVNLRVDYTIFQNDDDYKYYVKYNLLNQSKASVIKSSGLDLTKYSITVESKKLEYLNKELSLNVQEKTFILVSRMVKQKGVLNYLEAAKICYEKGFKYNFLLVGQLDSDNSISLEEIKNHKEYVKYLGRREDIKELMSLSNIFVLPTYYREGVPRVLLEASALGLPSITTNMPGCKDVIEDGYNGKLVNIKDSQNLANSMIELVHDENLNNYSQNAKLKVQEFNIDKVVYKYNKIYKKID
jgi:glycosyltransferase involved in cell wall biosynthesis